MDCTTHERLRAHRLGWLLCTLFVFVILSPAFGGPFSYQHYFTQLNGTKFSGTYHGDEYESWFTTEDGYTFVCKGPNAGPPYEYATLASNGDFTGSGRLVGVDTPPAEAYKLDRSGAMRQAIDTKIMQFENTLDDLGTYRARTLAACALGQPLTINVGIILIEFSDRPHIPGWEGQPYWSRWIGQTTENVETMMNSFGIYYGYQTTVPPEPGYDENRHPSMGQWACGSFREYWQKASYGLWDVPCTILNSRNGQGEAIWMTMNQNQHSYSDYTLNNEAITRARQLGWGVDNYDNIIILYPGQITPETDAWYGGHGNAGTTPPSTAWPLWEPGPMWEPEDGRFTQIGTMTHEWGHVIGWPDLRGGALASLMAQGNGGGPECASGGSAPTGLGAFCERAVGFYECFAQHGTGGEIHLTQDQFISIPARTTNGHWLYTMGGTAANPAYLLDSRWVNYDAQCGEIDDHIITRCHEIPPGTNKMELVFWDMAECGHPGTYCVVRNPKQSLTYMYRTDPGGGPHFWHVWPGSVTHSPNTVDWTPFTYPNTGLTGCALTGILSDDAARTISFTFHPNFPQTGAITISEPVYTFKNYKFTDNVNVVSPGVLWSQASYNSTRDGGGRIPNISFAAGKKLNVMQGGSIRGVPYIDPWNPSLPPVRSTVWTSATAGQRWGGIVVTSTDPNNSLAPYLTNATYGVRVQNGSLNLDRTTIRDCDVGLVWINSNGRIDNSTIRDNLRYGGYIIGGHPVLASNNIFNNPINGLKIWHANNAVFNDNSIYNNGSGHQTQNIPWAGLLVLDGSVTMHCNQIYGNEDAGMVLGGMSFAYMGHSGGMNRFENNAHAFPNFIEWDPGQISTFGGTPYVACGLNTFRDAANNRWLIRSPYTDWPADGWDATYNYWGTTDLNNIRARISGNPTLPPVLNGVWDCNNPNVPMCPTSDDQLLFLTGWQQEREAQFDDALVSYESLLNQFPLSKYAKPAADRIIVCKKAVNWSWNQIRQYFLTIAADSSKDADLVLLCKSNAAWCLAEQGQYNDALAELDLLLDHAGKPYLYLYLELKAMLAQLEQDNYEFLSVVGHNPGHGEERTSGALDAAIENFDNRFEEIDSQVNQLLSNTMRFDKSSPSSVLTPSTYALYQNYPNPFNPTTEIRFDLPEATRVELKIFNTLGQEVTTLIGDMRAAGTYTMQWNGTDAAGIPVSSGMYIYQIKAGNFTDAKKMLLMK